MAERKIQKKPVIIYLVPPKVIHAEASEFMALVQRLTGKSTSSPTSLPTSRAEVRNNHHRSQFPVRVKARLAWRGMNSETRHSTTITTATTTQSTPLLEELMNTQSSYGVEYGVAAVAPQSSSWFMHGGDQNESHNFIDIFQ